MSKYKLNKYKMLRATNLDENIGKNEKLIYNHLILCFDDEKGFAYPTYPELMQVLGVKRRNSVADTVEILRKKEYIETKKGFRGSNNYYLLKHITSNESVTSNDYDTSNKNDTRTSNESVTPLVTKTLLNSINNNLNNKVNINNDKKEIYINIFDFWNSKSGVDHKELKTPMINAINKALKKYKSVGVIKQAINNYDEILKSNYYYSHKFTLEKFLKQSNGISEFLEEGSVYENYLEFKKQKQQIQEQPKGKYDEYGFEIID